MKSVLGVTEADLQKILSEHLDRSITIDQLLVEKETEDLGGWNGEKALVYLRVNNSGEHRVILKRVTANFSRETEIYTLLNRLSAPVAVMFGYRDHPNGDCTLILEYLPISIDWPIPPDYHLKWADSTAKLAALPLPDGAPLRLIEWSANLDQYLLDVEGALQIDDDLLQKAISEYELRPVLQMSQQRVSSLLEEADQLPQSFNHGEPYSPHTGQRCADGEVLFFDIAGGAIGPRFMDLIALIIDHGEPYEIPVEQVARQYLDTYNSETSSDIKWQAFWPEVKKCRALVAIQRLRVTTVWVPRALDAEGQAKSQIWDGPRKWIILHLQALKNHLETLN